MLRSGYDAVLGSFVQYYGSDRLDASLLMIPLVGFLPPKDERVVGTVDAIERELMRDSFVERYRADLENVDVDGLPPGEGLPPCSFWLAAVLAQQDGTTTPSSSTSGFSRCGTTSACSRRSTTRASGLVGASRRRSH